MLASNLARAVKASAIHDVYDVEGREGEVVEGLAPDGWVEGDCGVGAGGAVANVFAGEGHVVLNDLG